MHAESGICRDISCLRQADSPARFWRFDYKELCQGASWWLMRSIATLSFESRVSTLEGRSCVASLLLLDSFGFLISLCRQRQKLRCSRIVFARCELLLPKDVNSKCLSVSLKEKKTPQLIKLIDGLAKRWLGDELRRFQHAPKSDISDISDVSILQWPAHIYAPVQWKPQAENDANAYRITKWKVQKHRGGVQKLLLQRPASLITSKKMLVPYKWRSEACFKGQIHLLNPLQALGKIEVSQETLSLELADSGLTSLRPQQSKPARNCMKLPGVGEKSAAAVRPTRSYQKILKYQHFLATSGALA